MIFGAKRLVFDRRVLLTTKFKYIALLMGPSYYFHAKSIRISHNLYIMTSFSRQLIRDQHQFLLIVFTTIKVNSRSLVVQKGLTISSHRLGSFKMRTALQFLT
jgi:hypothetical protein